MTSGESNTQLLFFDEIRKILAPHISFADELSEILNISRDSAYRRIRGETILSLDEVKKLSAHYNLSIDAIIGPASDIASFQYRMVDHDRFTFKDWLETILQKLSLLKTHPSGELWYFAKDLPVFYYFNYPLLSSFKMFFWMSSVLRYEGYRNSKFSETSIPRELTTIGESIYQRYISISRTEIWSEETLNITLRQIEFYHDSGLLADPALARQLCREYLATVNQIRSWAEAGSGTAQGSTFELYKNDLLIADNTILFKLGEKKIVFIPYNTLNILSTTNEVFCRQTDDYLRNLMSKSEKISTTGEKQRNVFFNKIQNKILALEAKLQQS